MVSEPLDRLEMVLQSADDQGHTLDELTGGSTLLCQRHLFGMLHPRHNLAPERAKHGLRLLRDHFGDSQASVVSTIAQQQLIWFGFIGAPA